MSWIANLRRYLAEIEIPIPFRRYPDEEVVVYRRQNLLFLVASRKVLLAAILLVALVIWSPLVHLLIFGQTISMYQLVSPFIFLGSLLLLVQQILVIARWFFRVYVVTTRRVFMRDGIWAREIREARLARVQNISRTTTGFFRNLFDVGDVQIETAGLRGTMLFQDVDHPDLVEVKVTKAINQYRAATVQLERKEIKRLLRETLSL